LLASELAAGVRDGIIPEGDFALIQVTLELILAMLAETQSPSCSSTKSQPDWQMATLLYQLVETHFGYYFLYQDSEEE
jgi:hypothetical protein